MLDRSETGDDADAARAKIVSDAEAQIKAQGELLRHDDWGNRTLTYPIDRKTEAEYHLFQFHSGSAELLSSLDRTLRIIDGVLRFRLIKLKPGVPDAPVMHTSAVATTAESAPEGVVEAIVEAVVEPALEAPAETTPEPGVEVEVGEPA
jgi:small subunit ribosomal protein S6